MIVSILPMLCWFFMFLTFYKKGLCLRSSFLTASLSWGLLVVAATELLSFFHMFNFSWLLITWGMATGGTVFSWRTASSNAQLEDNTELSLIMRLLLIGVVAIIILTGLIAAIAAPNNWDSMTYHMSRVMHWIQNQSVAHYPTNIIRQIELNPWAEFAITHFQILSGGDYLANLIQWFSMVGSVLGVTMIAKQFGANARGQLFAAIIAVTIPAGILQASSTQNDYVVAFWLVCFVYFGLLLKEKPCWHHTLAVGVSLGLAILTKGTAYIYALPFFAWFILSIVKSIKLKFVKFILVMIIITIAINFGHYARNLAIFNNPLTSGTNNYSNKNFTIATLISNISRNIALHTSTPSVTINKAVENSVKLLHETLGLDINDPNTTWPGTSFTVNSLTSYEDGSANPIHLLLILPSLLMIALIKSTRRLTNLWPYLLSISVSFLLFCSYLKWQPWHSRLHLPLFVLWSPIIAVTLANINKKWFSDTIMSILIIAALPWVLFNISRPLVQFSSFDTFRYAPGLKNRDSILSSSRLDQYFYNRIDIKESYFQCASLINSSNFKDIGLYLGEDDWEYPLWVLIQQKGGRKLRIEHIDVGNKSVNIALVNFNPSIRISIDKDHKCSVVSANQEKSSDTDIIIGPK